MARKELKLTGTGVLDCCCHLDLATVRRQCVRSGMNGLDHGMRERACQGNLRNS